MRDDESNTVKQYGFNPFASFGLCTVACPQVPWGSVHAGGRQKRIQLLPQNHPHNPQSHLGSSPHPQTSGPNVARYELAGVAAKVANGPVRLR